MGTRTLNELISEGRNIERLIREAYDLGVAEGGSAMRARILAAAGDLTGEKITSPTGPLLKDVEVTIDRTLERAPRGSVKPLVTQVLNEREGLTTSEFQARALAINPQVSPKSVENTLRRDTGSFKQERGRWYKAASHISNARSGERRAFPASSGDR